MGYKTGYRIHYRLTIRIYVCAPFIHVRDHVDYFLTFLFYLDCPQKWYVCYFLEFY